MKHAKAPRPAHSNLHELDFAIARIVLVCPTDERHHLGSLLRSDPEAFPEVGLIQSFGLWSDGSGTLAGGRGLLVLADSKTLPPLGIEALCRQCLKVSSQLPRPRLSWDHVRALLDEQVTNRVRDTRKAMDW